MSNSDWYTVWRRKPDGLVGATAGRGLPRSGDGLTLRNSSFTELLVTQEWPAAHARIRAERVAAKWYGDTWYCHELMHDGRPGCTPQKSHHNGFCGPRFKDEVVIPNG